MQVSSLKSQVSSRKSKIENRKSRSLRLERLELRQLMASDLSIASLDSFRVGSFQSPELQSGFSPLVASQVQLSGMDGLNHVDVDRELTSQADSFVVSVQALFAGIRSVGLTAVGLALERLS
jgi:hypothetical protein